MPKNLSVPLASYAPNPDNSPRALPGMGLDEITRNNTDYIDFKASVRPDWTPGVLLFTLDVIWNNDFASGWNVYGDPLDLDGAPATVWTARTYVPRDNTGGKDNVASGIIRLIIHAPFSSAFSAEAKAV